MNQDTSSAMEQKVKKSDEMGDAPKTIEAEQALKECRDQAQEWKDKFLRLSADFDNFKRRLDKDQASLHRAMQAVILLDVITILDDFDRAFSGSNTPAAAENLVGFSLIYKNFNKILEKHGVTVITDSPVFDPNIHEAVMNVPATDKHPAGSVVTVLEKGYKFKDQVLRPAKVSIAQ